MILCIGNVLTAARARELRLALDRAPFLDGRRTAGPQARAVKRNLQLDSSSTLYEEIAAEVGAALQSSTLFQAAVLPSALSPVLVNRYEVGMSYGTHVDNALMGQPALRADVSFTLFLSEPDAYVGGELTLEDTAGETPIKLAAGSAVVYPSTYLHRVNEVTSGVRYAVVGWVRSHVPSAEHRGLLFHLYQCKVALGERRTPDAERHIALLHSNLTRLWSN